jgi:hypothetical protein
MQSFFFKNLRLTIPTALAFTVLGYAISLPMSFYLDGYAARWQFNLLNHSEPANLSIQTQRLDKLREFQTMVALGGTLLGVVVAQTTFVVHTLALKENHGNES